MESMQRRTFLKLSGLTALSTLTYNKLWSQSTAAKKRPNILLIMCDELFADAMSCRCGKEFLNTPAMDSIAASGMSFTKAYSANPICMPSRTSMMTGHYPHQTYIQTNGGKGNKSLNAKPYCQIFKEAGYATGYVGKWHIPGMFATPKDFDFCAFNSHSGIDKKIVDPIVGFMKEKRDKPFLAVCSFSNPHNICEWARDKTEARLKDGDVGTPPPLDQLPPLRPNHENPKNETDTMALMRTLYHKTKKFPVGNYTEEDWRQYIWAYYKMCELVDGHIGELLKGLKETGQEDNTVVVFLSDHGDGLGSHHWNQKTIFYDESARVPFIIKSKGTVPAGTTNDRLVCTGIDLIPTLCDFAGIPIPKTLPGMSIKPTAEKRLTEDPRKYIVSQNHFTTKGLKEIAGERMSYGRMIRSKQYKYCLYDFGKRRESLVDMENDPGEMLNLVGSAEYENVLNQHRQYYLDWRKQYKDNDFPLPPKGNV